MMHSDTLLESDAELRTLVGAILRGGRKGELYLDDVFAICHRKPQSAVALRELFDRYHRSGQIPLEHHRKIRTRIEQALASRRTAGPTAASSDHDLEDLTCELPEDPPLLSDLTLALRPRAASAPGRIEEASRPGRPLRPPVTLALVPPPTSAAAPEPGLPGPDPAPPASPSAATRPVAATRPIAATTTIRPLRPDSRPERSSGPPEAVPSAVVPRLPALQGPAASGASPVIAPVPPSPVPPSPVPAASAGDDLCGQVLCGRYELQRLLGRGGMASVYEAIDRDRIRLGLADRRVALKVMRAHPARPNAPSPLVQEFQSTQRLAHPNIIHVFDIDQEGDRTCYSMELLSGIPLSHLLRELNGGVLPRALALSIIRDIGGAVAHAHARGIVHADLKPGNVMITRQGEVRVLDFGGSSVPPSEPWIADTAEASAVRHATPAYASCQQLERQRADPRDDLYALGCIAFVLLSGQHPYEGLSSIEARNRGRPARRPAGTPRSQWRVLRRSLSWQRERRTLSVQEWLRGFGLREAAAHLPPLAELSAAPRSSRRTAMLLLPLLAVTLGAWIGVLRPDLTWHRIFDGSALAHWLDELRGSPGPSAAATAAPTVAPPPPAASSPAAAPEPAARAAHALPHPAPALPDRHDPRGLTADRSTAQAGRSATEVTQAHATPQVAFAQASYRVGAREPAARILIRRRGDSQGDLNFIWWTEGLSAEPDVDYAALGARTERLASGQDHITVYVPIIVNPLRRRAAQFRVALIDATSHRGAQSAPGAHAIVTIEAD